MDRCGLPRRFSTVSFVIAAACLGLAASGVTTWLSKNWLGATVIEGGPKAQQHDVCSRPEPGSAIAEPADLRSQNGILETDLRILDEKLPDGTTRYCYLTADGKPSPNLRVKPGDELVIHFKNDLADLDTATPDTATPAIDRPLAGAPICTAKKA